MKKNRIESILTENAPAPIGPYSQAIRAGEWLFCSGQIALDPQTSQIVSGGVKEQTEQVMKNLVAVLERAGCAVDDIVKTTIFLKSMSDFPIVNEVYGSYFNESYAPAPARATVEVARLPKDVLVEIDCIAWAR